MKKVFITGGATGIGHALAIAFAKSGYAVGFSYCHSETKAEELARSLSEICPCYCFRADLSRQEEINRLAKAISETMGEVDVLIHNAALSTFGLLQDITESEYEHVFSVNIKAPVFLTKALLPAMIRRGSGSIINISSVWGQTGASCEVLYSSSKAALIGFTKALAKELAPSRISVNAIAPGVVDTKMMDRFTQEEKKDLALEIPSGRFATPEEIASAALFLAKEENRYLTGQVIGINGGMYC